MKPFAPGSTFKGATKPAWVVWSAQTVQGAGYSGKALATHSGILVWEIPQTEEPGRLQSMGYKESDTTEQLNKDIQNSPREDH